MNQKQLAHMHDGQRIADERLVFVLGGTNVPAQVAVQHSPTSGTVQAMQVIRVKKPYAHQFTNPR